MMTNEGTKQTLERSVGRPSKPMPDRMPDTPENIAKAIMSGPPKKNWRYLNKPR